MQKKQFYVEPFAEVLVLSTESMICQSQEEVTVPDYNEILPGLGGFEFESIL